jgi:hypothetical protein
VLCVLYRVNNSVTDFFNRVRYEGRLVRHTKFGLWWTDVDET